VVSFRESAALLALFLCGMWANETALAGYTTAIDNGPSSNRIDIVFLGDGYTAAEIETTYTDHIDSMVDHLFNEGEDPYPRYGNFFNVHRVDVISNESGADVPPEAIYRDTALDASYFGDEQTERLLTINTLAANQLLDQALSDAPFSAEMKIVTVNDTRYGGSGGEYAVFAGGHNAATEVALHELGHSFSHLADEYGGFTDPYNGPEPTETNVTTSSTGEKWSRWLGYNQPIIGMIGAYEGGNRYDSGIYRPSVDSKMRSLGRPFDAVSREKIILDIYDLVSPLDDWLANDVTLENPDPLWVDLIDPDVIDVQWRVDENLVADATGESFRPSDYGFGPGSYTITARAFDPTDWVRVGLDSLEQWISWNVLLTSPLVTPGDMDGDGDIDFDDIDDFVLGVTNAGLYEDTFGVPPSMRGDTDGDGDMDFDDIPGFVAMMPSLPRDNWLYAVPEPTTLFLAAISLLVALGWPRQRVRDTCQTDMVCNRNP
jgi:hypothetical protein